MLLVPALGGGGLVEAYRTYRQSDTLRDQQEHEQALDLSKAERAFREEIRKELRSLTEEMREMEGWIQRLVFALKHENWQKRRLFHYIDDLHQEMGRDPLDDEARAKYQNPHFEKALKDTPWGDLRGFSGPDGGGGPASKDDAPKSPPSDA